MNEVETLRKLAAAARPDRPPPVDVTRAVLDRIAARERRGEWVVWLFAATAAAAAVVVSVVAQHVAAGRQDAFADFLESMMTVMA